MRSAQSRISPSRVGAIVRDLFGMVAFISLIFAVTAPFLLIA